MRFPNQHVLITGAGRRIGRVVAEAFLKEGAHVSAHARHSVSQAQELIAFADGLKNGSRVTVIEADMCQVSQVKKAAARAQEAFGPVKVLVNCASAFYPTPPLTCEESQWDELMGSNLKGPFFLIQACAPGMLACGGNIINIADSYATRPLRGFSPYVASKAGLISLTRNLAKEWAPQIRVNCINPGPVLPSEEIEEERNERSRQRTLMKRFGAPQDIVEGIFFILSCSYLTGMELNIDGGRSLA